MKTINSLYNEITEIRLFIKAQGIKATFKKYRWRLLILILIYYLVRDLTLYVFFPIGISLIWG